MVRHQWLRALPLVVMATLAVSRADAGEIRDRAGMFSAEAVRKARAELDRTERRTGIPVLIETIEAIPGLEKDAPASTRRQAIETLAERKAREARTEGVYLLLSKEDKVSSQVLVRERYESHLPREARKAVRDAMVEQFKGGNYDQGLLAAVQSMDRSLVAAPAGTLRLRPDAAAPAPGVQHRRANAEGGKFGLGTLLMIGLGIFGVLLILRILGGLFGRSAGGYPAGMGMGGMPRPGMGPGPGYGPGYGGYGGRGGGFFSGMLGGLGGALAGNWLYDQFSGRHGGAGHSDASAYPVAGSPDPYGPGGDEFVGGNDEGGGGASWGDPGTGDTGGDWGGGDGGGDWGGGGGDWGGGGDGGDW